jgi:hypothetical protein
MAILLLFLVGGAAATFPVAPKSLPSKYVKTNDNRKFVVYSRDQEYDCTYDGAEKQDCSNIKAAKHSRASQQCGECKHFYDCSNPGGDPPFCKIGTFCSSDAKYVAQVEYTDDRCQVPVTKYWDGSKPYQEMLTVLGYTGASAASHGCEVHDVTHPHGDGDCGEENWYSVHFNPTAEPDFQCSAKEPPATRCDDIPREGRRPGRSCPTKGQPGPCDEEKCTTIAAGPEKLCKTEFWMEIHNKISEITV